MKNPSSIASGFLGLDIEFDDADEVALVDAEGEIVEHPDLTGPAGKGFSDVLDAELGRGRGHGR